MSEVPRTEAGRQLVEDEPHLVTGEHSMLVRVLAIEREAYNAGENEHRRSIDRIAEQMRRREAATLEPWREMIWLNHGHDGLYGDDGEMQCPHYPPTDFKRAALDLIDQHLFTARFGEVNHADPA